MIKVLISLLFLIISLHARENPFFPSDGEKDIPYTTNEDQTLPQLNRAAISLPPQARVIQSMTVTYKNLDGSQESKSIDLNHAVDWHLPIFISQSYTGTPPKEEEPSIKKTFEKIASIEYASFHSLGKSLKVVTNDEIIRNFLLVQPHRIVVDFKRDTDIKSYTKENKKDIFRKIKVGNHSGYYRAVIELDGYYRYTMTKVEDGYLFKLR